MVRIWIRGQVERSAEVYRPASAASRFMGLVGSSKVMKTPISAFSRIGTRTLRVGVIGCFLDTEGEDWSSPGRAIVEFRNQFAHVRCGVAEGAPFAQLIEDVLQLDRLVMMIPTVKLSLRRAIFLRVWLRRILSPALL